MGKDIEFYGFLPLFQKHFTTACKLPVNSSDNPLTHMEEEYPSRSC